MVLRTAVLMLAALVLSECGVSSGYVYLRADGQDLGSDPALYQQFDRDRMICESEMHRGGLAGSPNWHTTGIAGEAGQECMAEKGYVVVPADVAALKQQELAAKAAEKAQREAAAAAPPPPPPPPPPPVAPKHAAAKPKPKPKPKPPQVQPTAQPSPNWPTPQPPPS